MQVNVGHTPASVRAAASQSVSETSSGTQDSRRMTFIEVRERGTDNVIAKSSLALENVRFDRRKRNWQREVMHDSAINVLTNIAKGDFVEVYFAPKASTMSVKQAKLPNVMTPYVLVRAEQVLPHHEIVLVTPAYAVITTLARRKSFAREVFALAQNSSEALHKIAALKVLEQLMLGMVVAEQIPRDVAESKWRKYEGVSSRIWRGSTPGEQVAAFLGAWRILARVTGMLDEHTGDEQ